MMPLSSLSLVLANNRSKEAPVLIVRIYTTKVTLSSP